MVIVTLQTTVNLSATIELVQERTQHVKTLFVCFRQTFDQRQVVAVSGFCFGFCVFQSVYLRLQIAVGFFEIVLVVSESLFRQTQTLNVLFQTFVLFADTFQIAGQLLDHNVISFGTQTYQIKTRIYFIIQTLFMKVE